MNYLDCTTDHSVFVVGNGYTPADSIQPGDLLITPTGTKRVKAVENLPAPDFVFNLATSPNHNFFANNVLVHNCDDPIDPKRAVSEAELKTAADFVTNILPSRKVDKAVAVTTLIMQRLNFEDPTGVLLAKAKLIEGVGRIRHVCLPARLADNVQPVELREKYVDGLMDPVRLPEIVLREQEMLLGAYAFAGQYAQNPLPLSGGMFQITYFSQRIKAAPYHASRIRYWDRACLVAGTLVYTENGSVPIEKVLAGDHVLTRQGYKQVMQSWKTKEVDQGELAATVFEANGAILIGTKDHPVWTDNRGWAPLESLTENDKSNCIRDAPIAKMLPFTTPDPHKIPVYDLEVEDAREFFANGILVHNSTQDGGCYTAGVLMAKDEHGSYFIEHCVHGQWEPDKRNDVMRATALADRARYGPSHEPLIYVEAEGGSSGRDAWKGVARALAGFPVREHRPTGKKEIRAEPLACQLASKTIWIVEDGTWDVNSYIQEHVHFPLGKYKDQVDASSAAFSLLVQQRPTGGLRSYSLSHKKKQALRILICTPEQLANLSTTSRCLLIYLSDPQVEEMKMALPPEKPSPHSLPNILDTLHLHFLAASPADYQETWLEPVFGYGVLPEKLILSKEQVKKLWQRITLKRDPWIESILLVDEDTNRSTSIALAMCDALSFPRDATLGWVGKEDWHAKRDDKPVHQYLFDQVRLGRNLVV